MSSSMSAFLVALGSGCFLLNVVCVAMAIPSDLGSPGQQACLREGKQCGLYFYRGEVISPTCCEPLVCGFQDWEYYCLRQEEFLGGAQYGKRKSP